MKKLLPLILLTALVGCVDSNNSSEKREREFENILRELDLIQLYFEDFKEAFAGNLETDELVYCANKDIRKAFGCANYVLTDSRFELNTTNRSANLIVFYFTRKENWQDYPTTE